MAAEMWSFCSASKLARPDALSPCSADCLPRIAMGIGATIPRSEETEEGLSPANLQRAPLNAESDEPPRSDRRLLNPAPSTGPPMILERLFRIFVSCWVTAPYNRLAPSPVEVRLANCP